MQFFAAALAILMIVMSSDAQQYYSYSPEMGVTRGSRYTLSGEGRITALRVWADYYIRGIQFRYGDIWSSVAGQEYRTMQEIELRDGERIVQISGKYNYYLQWLVFVTSQGRSLQAGNPSGNSFNMYPTHKESELQIINGRVTRRLYTIAAHWGRVSLEPSSS